MKKLVLIAAVAALSACNQNKAEPAAAPSEAAATPAAVESAAAVNMAGTYNYTYQDKATVTVMNDDGTYEDSQDGKSIEKGTWSQKDGQTCFADDKGNPPKCWTTTEPDATGLFTATSIDGKTVLKITKKQTS
jgi:hypothetical protein